MADNCIPINNHMPSLSEVEDDMSDVGKMARVFYHVIPALDNNSWDNITYYILHWNWKRECNTLLSSCRQ